MEYFKVELEQLEQLLQQIRVAVEPLAGDERLRQWWKVNFDKHGDLLVEYGLKSNLKKSRDLVRATIETILQELAKLENEYGDLAIDIRRGAIQVAAAQVRLQTIKNQADLLAPELLRLQEHCRPLLEADTLVRRLPTLAGLLPGAKRGTPKNAPSLEQGLRFFLFATKEATDQQATSLAGIFARAAELERQLRAIEFTELPPMAVTLLEGLRQVGVRAADRLKNYIEDFQHHPPSEIRALQDFRQQLAQSRRREIGAIIDQLPQLSVRYGNLLLDLSLRARALRHNELMPALLDKLQLLHKSLGQALPAELQRQITTGGSPLNPEWLAAEQATVFFTGLRGVMLTFKLLFQTLTGNKSVNANELQRLTVGALTTLPYHGGGNELERTKIMLVLNEMLEEYDRPFPYELLLTHLQKVVKIHGGRLERAILGHSIRDQGSGSHEPDQKAARPDTTLARLIDKLETWSERFEVV
ncbi:hypothetical protein ACHHRT_07580 [Desulfurivibrio sp. D14AmB]|uniref:hypothetical protein n=1 Tax=Desulfurivibrio sp. D14AmB TaxID=3374370 RepID=UPI00376EC874